MILSTKKDGGAIYTAKELCLQYLAVQGSEAAFLAEQEGIGEWNKQSMKTVVMSEVEPGIKYGIGCNLRLKVVQQGTMKLFMCLTQGDAVAIIGAETENTVVDSRPDRFGRVTWESKTCTKLNVWAMIY